MRLTEQQIRETVNALRMSDRSKAVLIRQAVNNEAGGRFTVDYYYRRLHSQNPDVQQYVRDCLLAQ